APVELTYGRGRPPAPQRKPSRLDKSGDPDVLPKRRRRHRRRDWSHRRGPAPMTAGHKEKRQAKTRSSCAKN
ncbi:MAG TPA: hypothetical protein DCZ93_08755, partial [Elusimicrobia bacterium]|nr:hypothetical protein [Elusimicrobiota bacterium]